MFQRLGPVEILLILFVILLLFGGSKLPQLARGLGQGIREFKGALRGEGTGAGPEPRESDRKESDPKGPDTKADKKES
ncbi:MAG: twin-arginine translocase TatA/TatE family subunit [Firmicutes bacterium]|nr:twin-arginine translocase TatA/TatE family subunit [Bacillota bacterium]